VFQRTCKYYKGQKETETGKERHRAQLLIACLPPRSRSHKWSPVFYQFGSHLGWNCRLLASASFHENIAFTSF